jgi:hypothetical protein
MVVVSVDAAAPPPPPSLIAAAVMVIAPIPNRYTAEMAANMRPNELRSGPFSEAI